MLALLAIAVTAAYTATVLPILRQTGNTAAVQQTYSATTTAIADSFHYLVARMDQAMLPAVCHDWVGKYVASAQAYYGRACGHANDVHMGDDGCLRCASCDKRPRNRKPPAHGYGSTDHPIISHHHCHPGLVGALDTMASDMANFLNTAVTALLPNH